MAMQAAVQSLVVRRSQTPDGVRLLQNQVPLLFLTL